MREEISAAVIFLVRLIEKGENVNHVKLEEFKTCLSELLTQRFKNHWFPDSPQKGQGYRCIRVNETDRHDVSLVKAAKVCGIKYEDMNLPVELTIWVDPKEVCCRFGENKGSYCTLASFNDKENLIEVSEEVEQLLQTELIEVVKPQDEQVESVTTSPKPVQSEEVGDEKKIEDKETVVVPTAVKTTEKEAPKLQVAPLMPHNSRQPHQRKYPQGSPKQKSRRGGNMSGGYPHHPMQPWYNVISPHWMNPSPPPYPHMMRRHGPPPHHPPHPHQVPHRYHWPNKSMLKV